MSWLQHLFETYETCYGHEPDGSSLLMPIAHTTQKAHIEIVLDDQGRFLRAEALSKENGTTLIPCTESSGGRAGSKPTSHPLCDKLQYVAADYVEFGGEVTSGFAKDPSEPHREYLQLLSGWAASSHAHPKLDAILAYVRRGHVISDLVDHQVLQVDAAGRLAKTWEGEKDQVPSIYKALSPGQLPEDAFIRWRVEGEDIAAGTWQDAALLNSWISYYAQMQTQHGYCMVQGKETTLAVQHPAKLRNAADKAKLISANDDTGFTYRGRFLEAEQAVGVGYEATQKAHNALRWLIERQGSRSGSTQVIVSWTVAGLPVPDPMRGSVDEFGYEEDTIVDTSAGQRFALRLKKAINGYRGKLKPSEQVHVIALDSATPGRMSITFYRSLPNSEFLRRIEDWHMRFAWPQKYGKEREFVGAPAPGDIAQAAYGRRLDAKLEAATRERLLPCIVDQLPFPSDLHDCVFRNARRRTGMEVWEWEKNLGIACALFKGIHPERSYQMALEPGRTSRDYLYGRLLAMAENIENYALRLAEEKRDTNAARNMQQFAERPFSTWRTIELSLAPYKTRLRSRVPGFLERRERQIDEIQSAFQHDDYVSDKPLSGEFLLGYHCQREALWQKNSESNADATGAETATTESN